MKPKTVKQRIFLSNTLMVLTVLILYLIVNVFILKAYWEGVEHRYENVVGRGFIKEKHDMDDADELFHYIAMDKDDLVLFVVIDAGVCIILLFAVSQVFTKNLVKHISEPLEQLNEAARRVQDGNLTQNILYSGDEEFETTCGMFNDMQQAILSAQEKNQKYEKARTDMIAGISHDLRTPLTAIRGTVKALKDGVVNSPEQQEKFLNSAYNRTEEMSVLINRLFYFSKLETGNMPIEKMDIDMNEFLVNYAQAKNVTLAEDQVCVRYEETGNPVHLNIDPDQMMRIIDNLVENSRKYAEIRPLNIDFELVKNGDFYKVRVHDNGKGVDEEKLSHVFEEFYRGDESRNKTEGSGLGLYIVKYLVESMNGNVMAMNDHGFTVEMTFPEINESRESHETA